MVPTRRARRDEQKEERRQDIVDAAWRLFQETSYAAVTMAQVAERACLAKGTLYLYFTTKEELFLSIIDQELKAWFEHVDGELDRLSAELANDGGSRADAARRRAAPAAPAEDAAARIAAILSESLVAREAMTRLMTLLNAVLEQNVSYEAALRFKLSLVALVRGTGAQLERCLPFLAPGEGVRLLIQMYALVLGLRQVSDPGALVRDVHRYPEIAPFRIDFGEEVRASIGLLLGGRERQARQSRGAVRVADDMT